MSLLSAKAKPNVSGWGRAAFPAAVRGPALALYRSFLWEVDIPRALPYSSLKLDLCRQRQHYPHQWDFWTWARKGIKTSYRSRTGRVSDFSALTDLWCLLMQQDIPSAGQKAKVLSYSGPVSTEIRRKTKGPMVGAGAMSLTCTCHRVSIYLRSVRKWVWWFLS